MPIGFYSAALSAAEKRAAAARRAAEEARKEEKVRESWRRIKRAFAAARQ